MSGIYIPGMKMPSGCASCDFANYFTDGEPYCRRLTRKVPAASCLPDCPLVPVLDHGRLIDADTLIDKVVAKYLKQERKGELVFAAVEIKQDICDLICAAPTIIPAEEGKT